MINLCVISSRISQSFSCLTPNVTRVVACAEVFVFSPLCFWLFETTFASTDRSVGSASNVVFLVLDWGVPGLLLEFSCCVCVWAEFAGVFVGHMTYDLVSSS